MKDFIVRKKCANRFTNLSNQLLQESNLSFKALGMLAYLLSLPPDWRLNMEHLQNKGKSKGKHGCGRDAVRSIVKELQEEGYLQILREREHGKFIRTVWFLSEEPDLTTSPPQADFPPVENPPAEKPSPEIRPLQKISLQKHKNTKNHHHKSKGEKNLNFPKIFAPPEVDALKTFFADLDSGQAQAILDEVAGLAKTKKIRTSAMSLAVHLVKKLEEGAFVPTVGLAIAEERRRAAAAREKEKLPPRSAEKKPQIPLRDRLNRAGIQLGHTLF